MVGEVVEGVEGVEGEGEGRWAECSLGMLGPGVGRR